MSTDAPVVREPAADRIRIGVSSCLLGQEVRYNGGHKRDAFLVETFGRYVDWLPVCPEVELGMGTPREPVRLVRDGEAVRMVGTTSQVDHTTAMRSFARRRAAELAADGLCGYVLKKDSPSCGMERVRVYGAGGMPARSGRGFFAEALMQRYPTLPVEEEGRLCDPRLRENFVERVFAYRRLRGLFDGRWKLGDMVAFHTAHKLQLLAHSTPAYQELGRLVAGAKALTRGELRERYEAVFMAALQVLATPRRHVNVLQHMIGYFRQQLDDASRRELLALVEDYRSGLVPLIVPITLIRHYVRRFAVAYLDGQTYLDPHPKELMLRNHV
ncbi:MAG: YbgA [Deltaproteobacteria bacterium]|nr:YbgA [Deltaproteobacteria bacterium]